MIIYKIVYIRVSSVSIYIYGCTSIGTVIKNENTYTHLYITLRRIRVYTVQYNGIHFIKVGIYLGSIVASIPSSCINRMQVIIIYRPPHRRNGACRVVVMYQIFKIYYTLRSSTVIIVCFRLSRRLTSNIYILYIPIQYILVLDSIMYMYIIFMTDLVSPM